MNDLIKELTNEVRCLFIGWMTFNGLLILIILNIYLIVKFILFLIGK